MNLINIIYLVNHLLGLKIRTDCSLRLVYTKTMVEIYKVIAYISFLLNQIFDDKNKNGRVKDTNNNQV